MKLYTIPAHRRGDTWDGLSSIGVEINGAPASLTGATITMELKQTPSSPTALKFSTIDSTITILPSLTAFSIPARIINVPPASYFYDIQINFPSGIIKTYMGGKWEILYDITE